MPYWSVVQTVPQRERLAIDSLQSLGYETYFPRIYFKKLGKQRITALFPTYVFLRVCNDQWWSARWAMGVLRILSNGNKPAVLADDIVKEISGREINGFVRLKEMLKLKKGQRVRIIGGRFDGQLALYEGQSVHERERVLLELLGRMVPVELAASDRVEPLNVAIR